MRAFYNEIDAYCCAWLSNLMDAGHITPGVICDKSIVDLTADDIRGFDRVHFFAGIAGWELALNLAGWGRRPVWTGSCPCQPFSAAGKQRGSDDERHLWPAFGRLIRECRPGTVFGEQVAGAGGIAWWDHVAGDLEAHGYAAAAGVIPAGAVGAPHRRERLWWVADADAAGQHRRAKQDEFTPRRVAAPRWHHVDGRSGAAWAAGIAVEGADGARRLLPPGVECVADGLSECLAGFGNAIVPQVAAEFIHAYCEAGG